MKKELTTKQTIKLIGLSTRTNNKNEINPQTAQISHLVRRYNEEQIAARLANRKNPGVTFSVYTAYDSNEHGDYTYFLGEEVETIENVPEGLDTLIIPAAQYQKFTTPQGKMPDVVISAWQQIWNMTSADFNGERTYQADFEIYDERASDPFHTMLDIYIGIK